MRVMVHVRTGDGRKWLGRAQTRDSCAKRSNQKNSSSHMSYRDDGTFPLRIMEYCFQSQMIIVARFNVQSTVSVFHGGSL